MSEQRKVWACDFETYPSPEKTWVWIWGAQSIYDDCFTWNNTIESFVEWALQQKTLYFHNLRFDGSFIVDYLLKAGWTHVYGKGKLSNQTFTTTISSSNKWYSLKLRSEHGTVSIYDSYKKLPFTLAKIAKSFDLGETKGDIDYMLYREPGHIPTPEEMDYLQRDCSILAKALRIQLDQGLTKITIGSDALSSYKEIMGKYYRYFFPYVNDVMDHHIRKSYKGGYTYLHRPGDHGETICLDVNSLYPYAMTMPLPIGSPVYFKGEYQPNQKYPLFVQMFNADFKLKKGFLPTVQLKRSRWHIDTEYVIDSHGLQTMTLTSVDLEIFRRHYEIFEYHPIEGFMFQARTGLFDNYINYWMSIKSTNTGAVRELAKLMLNNLYGKFAKNPDVTQKIPILENDRVKMVIGPPETGKTVYIPCGSFITANARSVTINAAQANFDRFIYSDTDSLHLIGKHLPDGVRIHDTELGAWDHEYTSHHSRYLRAKRYIVNPYKDKSGTGGYHPKIVCAGMPDNIKESACIDDFVTGTVFNGKLSPVLVPGGTYLRETTFELK